MPLRNGMSRSTWRLLAVIYVSMFAMTLASGLWATYVADQNNRRWCGVLRVYHDAYANSPEEPLTQPGRDIKKQLEQLYRDFRCESVSKP